MIRLRKLESSRHLDHGHNPGMRTQVLPERQLRVGNCGAVVEDVLGVHMTYSY